MSTTKTRRSLSLLAAFAVAAGALALPAAASQATPTFGLAATTERAPSLVDLDAAKTGSITIHKLVKQDDNGTKEGNGLLDPSATGKPLAGATFTVENGYVTPSMKLRRRKVIADYAYEIDALYGGPVSAEPAKKRGLFGRAKKN